MSNTQFFVFGVISVTCLAAAVYAAFVGGQLKQMVWLRRHITQAALVRAGFLVYCGVQVSALGACIAGMLPSLAESGQGVRGIIAMWPLLLCTIPIAAMSSVLIVVRYAVRHKVRRSQVQPE